MITKLTIEYDGTDFAGWARQPHKRTVQAELERALRTVLGDVGHDERPLTVTVAGRTDAGVHAWGQVVSYAHEAVDPQRLNGLLDRDVAVLAAEPAPAGFDARRDATSRTYCYRVLARRTRSVFERRCGLLVDRARRPLRARALRRRAARHARLHRVHAHRNRALLLRLPGHLLRMAGRRRGARVLDRGRHVPAPHEPRARRHDARRRRGPVHVR